jgi:hypothetical protein
MQAAMEEVNRDNMARGLPSLQMGIGIDTGRYGHHVSFLRDDKRPAVSSGERLYRISGEGLFGWNLLIPANQAIRISGWVRP